MTEPSICPGCERALAERFVADTAFADRFEALILEAAGDTIPKGAKLAFVVAETGREEPECMAGRCPLCSESVERRVEAVMAEAEARIVERFSSDDGYMRRFSSLVAAAGRKLGREVPDGAVLALIRPSWSAPLSVAPPASPPSLLAALPPIPDHIDEAEVRRHALALSIDDIARAVLLGFSAVATQVPAGKEIPVLHALEVSLRGLADHPGLRDAVQLAADRLRERRELAATITDPRPTAPGGQA